MTTSTQGAAANTENAAMPAPSVAHGYYEPHLDLSVFATNSDYPLPGCLQPSFLVITLQGCGNDSSAWIEAMSSALSVERKYGIRPTKAGGCRQFAGKGGERAGAAWRRISLVAGAKRGVMGKERAAAGPGLGSAVVSSGRAAKRGLVRAADWARGPGAPGCRAGRQTHRPRGDDNWM